MIICTQEAKPFVLSYDSIYNPNQIELLAKRILKLKPKKVNIYDLTISPNKGDLPHIPVNDHVNRTGSNPLIGKQNYFKIDFIDIKELYQQHTQGITTFSCGTMLNKNLPYPSHFLCHIGILCKALRINKIHGTLINTNHPKFKKNPNT